ncbi:MAG: site-2 protease family protein [Christensenellales bacterium]
MRFRFSPLFLILLAFYALTGQLYMLIGYMISIFMHELAHERTASWRGYKTLSITLMPFGGVMESQECYHGRDNIIISLAGPIFNFCIAICVVAAWWLLPSCYVYTLDICIANVTMGAINLLPLYPLDGYRIVTAWSKNKLRAVKIIKIATLVSGVVIFGLGIATLFFAPNLSICVMGLFLFFGAIGNSENEVIGCTSQSSFIFKNCRHGLRKTTFLISEEAQLFRCIALMNNREYVTFEVIDDKGKILCTLTENQVRELCSVVDTDTTLKDCLNKATPRKADDDFFDFFDSNII